MCVLCMTYRIGGFPSTSYTVFRFGIGIIVI